MLPAISSQTRWAYRAEFIPRYSGSCLAPLHFVEYRVNAHSPGYQPLPPRTPRMRCIPLPPNAPTMAAPTIFPLEITSDIPLFVASTLSTMTIPTSTAIHVHAPTSHIGYVRADPGAQTALEVIQFVQRSARGPFDPATYQSLSWQTKMAVEGAFIRRVSQTMGLQDARQLWSLFVDGHYHPNGPCGTDLLLGSTHIWSLDAVPGSGVCYLQVA